ncbi:MAG: hypothetical protein LBQ89_02860 [Treponema sp.]|jgi:flagellar biosynthesis GTPase FlhF|nr:hypothetical protein [Treponema sp.]
MKTIKHFLLKYRTLLAIIILAGIASAIYAQVDEDELSGLPPVVFLNYEGPHTRIDTREEIRQIGVVLGQRISSAEGSLSDTFAAMSAEQRRYYSYIIEAGATNRYFVIHCVSGPEDDKIDADIFVLGVDAGVDHIRNLRTIVQGYLQAAYGYSERDAALLAEYITVYNAVYRGNWDYFVGRYKTQVINNLIRDRAGLSIRYDEWPGRTMMLIPLGHGGLSSIDTTTITDRRVIEELRREDDQGVPQRQGMVDLLEREAGEAERQAQTEREAIKQEESQIAEERTQTAQERQNIEQERQSIQEDQQAGRITEEEAGQAQQELDRREQAVEQREQEIEGREDDLDQRREEAQRLEDFAEQKTEEAQQQREEIARDQQAAIIQETSDVLFGITIEKENPARGRLVRFNPVTGAVLRRSPLDTVHVRTVTFIGGRILAIAGENEGYGAVRLVEINQNSLEMAKQGDDDIRPGSLLWVNGSDLYAITNDLGNGNCYLGRFDTNLVLQTKTTVRVHPDAGVTIQQGRLLTQREDGSVLILNPADLTVIW